MDHQSAHDTLDLFHKVWLKGSSAATAVEAAAAAASAATAVVAAAAVASAATAVVAAAAAVGLTLALAKAQGLVRSCPTVRTGHWFTGETGISSHQCRQI